MNTTWSCGEQRKFYLHIFVTAGCYVTQDVNGKRKSIGVWMVAKEYYTAEC